MIRNVNISFVFNRKQSIRMNICSPIPSCISWISSASSLLNNSLVLLKTNILFYFLIINWHQFHLHWQGWCVEADLESEYLKLKLYFMDMHSVPRNHLRYVSWYTFVNVLNLQSGVHESVAIKNAPHFSYYIQDGIDMGVVMETNILSADVCYIFFYFDVQNLY